MVKLKGGRTGFRTWIDKQPDPSWGPMPLTHITKGIGAEDIIRDGAVEARHCKVFDQSLAYFFYGRPAYRVSGEGTLRVEAACPFCFVFKAGLLSKALSINAFDTGAFDNRMYKHVLLDEMNVEDFSLENDPLRPNRLISAVFGNIRAYFDGDISQAISAESGAEAWEFHAKAYLDLLASPGRNEPDDRICSIEVVFGEKVELSGNLEAVVVPHTLWSDKRAPWLTCLGTSVEIIPYSFVPGRHPEHYHALLEIALLRYYERKGLL